MEIFTIMPIQRRFSKNIWPFFTNVAPLPMWFLQPWLSTTNDFYRNYQELDGGKMGTENNFVGHFPPPPCPSPDAATGERTGAMISLYDFKIFLNLKLIVGELFNNIFISFNIFNIFITLATPLTNYVKYTIANKGTEVWNNSFYNQYKTKGLTYDSFKTIIKLFSTVKLYIM